MANIRVLSEVRGRIVAILLTHRGRLCLLRRSRAVGSDRGRWHCVTGFLPTHAAAPVQALAEVAEETGVRGKDLRTFIAGPVLRLPDPRGGVWIVHSYRCEVAQPDIRLNWENDDFSWVYPGNVGDLPVVDWLHEVAAAVGAPMGSHRAS